MVLSLIMSTPKRAARKKSNRITLHDVARQAGVSVTTASYALNDKGSVSQEIRKSVRKAATKLGYRQNWAARAMKIGHSDIIGLVIPNIENPFFSTLAKSILLESQKQKYQVFLVDTEGSHESEHQAINGLIQQGVDGIIVFPIDDSELFKAGAPDVPVVIMDRDNSDHDLVQAEYFAGGRILAEHLQALGHRKFGLLEGPQYVSSARARSEGFIDALTGKSRIVWRYENPFSVQLIERAKQHLAELDVTAIACGNDLIAMGAIQFLHSRGVAIPKQVSIVGFDDILFTGIITPALTTIHIPVVQMGVEAVNLLIRRLHATDKNFSRSRIVLGVELVVRESSGAA